MDESGNNGAPEGAMIDATDWQARAGHIRQVLAGAPDTAVAEALGTFLFADDSGKTWTYNGAAWMSWDGSKWSEGSAMGVLRLQPFLHDTTPAMAESEAKAEIEAAAADAAPTEAASDMEPILPMPDSMTGATAMTPEMPAVSVAEEEPVETMAMADATSDVADDEPAMAAEKTTELAADTAESTWSSSTSMADKPALADKPAMTDMSAMADKPAMTDMSAMADKPATTQDFAASTSVATSGVPASSASPAAAAANSAASTPGAFRVTHTVPMPGMGAWTKPDPTVRPEYQLAARTELMVVEMLSSGWARVAGSNGWTGWVDGRMLVAAQAAAATPQVSQPAMQQPAQTWQQPVQPQTQPWQPTQQPQPAQPAQPQAAAQPMQPAQQMFRPTHAVPPMGMPAWAQPNPALPPAAQLAPGTPLTVAEYNQSGWARVVASNGWSGWVDGRMLVAYGQAPYQR